MQNIVQKYPVLRNQPIAKFFYKGQSHTHPVRRTVLLTETTKHYLRGYELREGSEARDFLQAPIKTYSKTRIAKIRQIDARRVLRANALKGQLDNTTLKRLPVAGLIKEGV